MVLRSLYFFSIWMRWDSSLLYRSAYVTLKNPKAVTLEFENYQSLKNWKINSWCLLEGCHASILDVLIHTNLNSLLHQLNSFLQVYQAASLIRSARNNFKTLRNSSLLLCVTFTVCQFSSDHHLSAHLSSIITTKAPFESYQVMLFSSCSKQR